MAELELTAGTIDYEDTGDGPVLVLLGGVSMDGSVWDPMVADLQRDHRCQGERDRSASTNSRSRGGPYPCECG